MKFMVLSGRFVLLLTICLSQVTALRGDDVDQAGAKASLDSLVRELGSSSYKEREDATAELLRRGLDVRPVLTNALDDFDLEIRMRAAKLLVAIESAELNRRLSAFLNDHEGKQEHQLPGWDRFTKIVGNERTDREWFVEMFRAETELLSVYATKGKGIETLYNQRIQALQMHAIPGINQKIDPASLSALLLVGSHAEVTTNTTMGYQLYSLLNQTAAATAISTGPRSSQMQRLLTAWLQQSATNDSLARNGLMLALRYKMKNVGLDLGRKLLAKKTTSHSTLQYVVLTIGKYGGKSDAELLKPLLTNKTVCHTWHNGRFKNVIKIQVRDVVLATLVHMTNQNHKTYGFDMLRKYDMTLFHVYTCGFAEDKQRETAFAKWDAWSAQQKAG